VSEPTLAELSASAVLPTDITEYVGAVDALCEAADTCASTWADDVRRNRRHAYASALTLAQAAARADIIPDLAALLVRAQAVCEDVDLGVDIAAALHRVTAPVS